MQRIHVVEMFGIMVPTWLFDQAVEVLNDNILQDNFPRKGEDGLVYTDHVVIMPHKKGYIALQVATVKNSSPKGYILYEVLNDGEKEEKNAVFVGNAVELNNFFNRLIKGGNDEEN